MQSRTGNAGGHESSASTPKPRSGSPHAGSAPRKQHHRLGQQRIPRVAERFWRPKSYSQVIARSASPCRSCCKCVGATELTNLHTDLGVHLRETDGHRGREQPDTEIERRHDQPPEVRIGGAIALVPVVPSERVAGMFATPARPGEPSIPAPRRNRVACLVFEYPKCATPPNS